MKKTAFIIAGASSGCGKTTVTLGLMAAFIKRGLEVQPYKTGPDYLDPCHHNQICKRSSYNLDTWMAGTDGVNNIFNRTIQKADIGVVEGVMGLFDGKDPCSEEGSTAHLAKVLNIPVILVVDGSGMARSAAALIYGFENFDPELKIRGVIFNKLGSENHFKILKESVESNCKAKVYGYIPKNRTLSLTGRYLGLIDSPENRFTKNKIDSLVNTIEEHIDINTIGKINCINKIKKQKQNRVKIVTNRKITPAIAVAMDEAFYFYYKENLDLIKESGGKIVYFSPLKDKKLPPNTSGVYFGGGYPELYAKKLSLNSSMKVSIKKFIDYNGPVYAECGGLMYLGKNLIDLENKRYDMVGIFSWTSKMCDKFRSLGYREIKLTENSPYLEKGEIVRGHEFHYSEISRPENIKYCYFLTGRKVNDPNEGFLYKNTLASYVHIHFASNLNFAENFVKKSFDFKENGAI